jgi:hypothetical protein
VSVPTKTFIESAEDHAQALHHTAPGNSGGINVDVLGNFFTEEHIAWKHLSRHSAQAVFVKVPVTLELFVVLLASLYIRLDDDVVQPGLAVPGQSVTKIKWAKSTTYLRTLSTVFLKTMQRPNPRSQLDLFIVMASSISYPPYLRQYSEPKSSFEVKVIQRTT